MLRERVALAAELKRRFDRTKLYRYKPYAKQKAFHAAGSKYRERLLRAGNQLGKTYSGAAEMAIHLSGKYPDWWEGRRWDRPITAWAGGKDGISVRDSLVTLLLGTPQDRGTGLIPGDLIEDIATARGLADAVDTVTVRHVSGGTSRLTFKTYLQGREQWQAATLDCVWFDEEPGADIYSEGLTRTNATGGMVFMTFTPLLGLSEVVRRFLTEESPDRNDTNMTIEDAEHIPPLERQRIINSYPPHEREARTKGTPILGSGRIFPIAEEDIAVEDFTIPTEWGWAWLGAMDFGWDHPFAAVLLRVQPDADGYFDDGTVYVTRVYRAREETPIIHARTLRTWARWPDMWWAWPHDGLQHSKDSGEPLAKQYKANGLNLTASRATYPDGSAGVEAGLMDMLERMQTGRFKVFKSCHDWFEEFRLYHRKDGKVVKEHDDLMSATRYGVMMLRKAECEPRLFANKGKPRLSDPLGDFR